jgi:hypothetical protein
MSGSVAQRSTIALVVVEPGGSPASTFGAACSTRRPGIATDPSTTGTT